MWYNILVDVRRRFMEIIKNIEIWNYLAYFFIYSFSGWIIEVAYHAFTKGKFINRGFLAGMVCPIYGFGAITIVFLLEPIKDNLFILFIGAVLICTILEYLVGFFLDRIFHKRWWDYSDVPFNLGGYVCIQFSVYWGIAGVILVRDIHFMIENLVSLIDLRMLMVLCGVSVISILVDLLASVQNVLKLNKKLALLEEMQLQIYDLSNMVGEGVSDTTLDIINRVDPVLKDFSERKNAFGEAIDKEILDIKERKDAFGSIIERELSDFKEIKTEAQLKLEELKIKRNELINSYRRGEKRIITAFPKLREDMYTESFEEFRRAIREKLNKR